MAFGVDRVHRHRAFTATAGPAEHSHFVSSNINIDTAKIVLVCATNCDLGSRFRLFLFLGLNDRRFGSGPFRAQHSSESGTGKRFGTGCDFFRWSFADDSATASSTIRSEVDHPVSRFDNVRIVFNDQNRVTEFDKVLQNAEQHFNVGKMESRSGLVQ